MPRFKQSHSINIIAYRTKTRIETCRGFVDVKVHFSPGFLNQSFEVDGGLHISCVITSLPVIFVEAVDAVFVTGRNTPAETDGFLLLSHRVDFMPSVTNSDKGKLSTVVVMSPGRNNISVGIFDITIAFDTLV